MDLSEVKAAIFRKTIVKHKDIKYTITGCIMRFGDGEWYYQLELHDLMVSSVIIAKLDDVELL
ncbi:MAG: hypothetical protein ACYCWE_13065 [Eubacteriales bacterium]